MFVVRLAHKDEDTDMTRYWVVALIVAVVGLLYIVRRVARRSDADDERSALVPHGDGERQLPESDPLARAAAFADDSGDLDERDSDDLDDTAPSVLSPPEWTPPRSASNGSRR
jgi:hypothetical protein